MTEIQTLIAKKAKLILRCTIFGMTLAPVLLMFFPWLVSQRESFIPTEAWVRLSCFSQRFSLKVIFLEVVLLRDSSFKVIPLESIVSALSRMLGGCLSWRWFILCLVEDSSSNLVVMRFLEILQEFLVSAHPDSVSDKLFSSISRLLVCVIKTTPVSSEGSRRFSLSCTEFNFFYNFKFAFSMLFQFFTLFNLWGALYFFRKVKEVVFHFWWVLGIRDIFRILLFSIFLFCPSFNNRCFFLFKFLLTSFILQGTSWE